MQDFFNNFFDRPYRTLQYPAKNYAKSIEVNNDSYTLMIRKFMKGVATQMIDIVVKEHNIPEEEALDFIEYMISCTDKRKNEIEEIVEKCYKEGNSKLECARILLDKYYKITKINVYKDKSEHEEITGVNESIRDFLKPKSEEDIEKELEKLSPTEKLFKGCKYNLVWLVKQALDSDLELSKGRNDDDSRLHDAIDAVCMNGNIDILKLFLKDNRFDPTHHDNSPIFIAFADGNKEIVKILLNDDRVKKLLPKDELYKYTKYIEGLDESVKDYLKPKSEEEIIKSLEKTEPYDLLYISIIKGYLPGIKMSIDKGVDLEDFDALEMAVSENKIEIVKYLINIGVNIPEDISTMLQIAYEYDNIQLMDYLIKIYLDKYHNIKKLIKYAENNDYDDLRWNYLNKFDKVIESVQTEVQKPNASLSLFINFITKLKDLNVKFIFNTKLISGLSNSLNTQGYNFYIETKPINNKEIEFEFKYSRILSSILKSFDMFKNITNDISFYIGIDKNNFLNFGYIINNQKIKIGFLKYRTQDIQKLSDMIECTDKEINFKILSQKFLSTLSIIQYYKGIFNQYLHNYDGDIEVYTSIIDNKFAVIIESINSDVINKKYLSSIVDNNVFYVLPVQYESEISTTKINNKLYYYFTIKK